MSEEDRLPTPDEEVGPYRRDPRSTSTTEAPQSGLVEATTTVRRLGPTDGLAPASVWPHLDSRHRRA